ncbi:MAG: LptA/OstA family protein [Rhodospirillales bacterium]
MSRSVTLLLVLAAAVVLVPFSSAAQTLSIGSGPSAPPIDVRAERGIEWLRGERIIRAIGDVRALRGDLEVRADVLSAHYRERADGNTEVWRVVGDGNVRITTPSETAYADKGVYDLDSAVVVLSGATPVRLVTAEAEVTADRQIEFRPETQTLVAQGNAIAVKGDSRLKAETLTAHFSRETGEGSRLKRVEAAGDVHLTTPNEVLRADRGVYDLETGIASLLGSVRITRGENQLNGCRAEIDMNAGRSKIFGCGPGEDGGRRVRGLIQPEAVPKN